jgi:AhpC/TSA family
LHATPDQTLTLKGLRGRPVILTFYPADWSPVCGDQMALYNEVLIMLPIPEIPLSKRVYSFVDWLLPRL